MGPPRHTKVRRLLAAAFTPKQIALIGAQIRGNATRVVDDLAPRGEADFVTECAALLPMQARAGRCGCLTAGSDQPRHLNPPTT
ncbi:hypothetical protein [Mycobacterium sp.]|jgi:cytochrome P450|uniref:hypothetical protein n=1 Tax=Mycobacterium sp. TaxID=1785 RepID=UPI0025E862C4|nr:hypothetical protein [Mycobacterium sp.]